MKSTAKPISGSAFEQRNCCLCEQERYMLPASACCCHQHVGLQAGILDRPCKLQATTVPQPCNEVTPWISVIVAAQGGQSSWRSLLLEDATIGLTSSSTVPSLEVLLLNYIKKLPACSCCHGEMILYYPFPFWRSSQEQARAESTVIGLSGNSSIWCCILWHPFKRSAKQLPSTCAKGKRCLFVKVTL